MVRFQALAPHFASSVAWAWPNPGHTKEQNRSDKQKLFVLPSQHKCNRQMDTSDMCSMQEVTWLIHLVEQDGSHCLATTWLMSSADPLKKVAKLLWSGLTLSCFIYINPISFTVKLFSPSFFYSLESPCDFEFYILEPTLLIPLSYAVFLLLLAWARPNPGRAKRAEATSKIICFAITATNHRFENGCTPNTPIIGNNKNTQIASISHPSQDTWALEPGKRLECMLITVCKRIIRKTTQPLT